MNSDGHRGGVQSRFQSGGGCIDTRVPTDSSCSQGLGDLAVLAFPPTERPLIWVVALGCNSSLADVFDSVPLPTTEAAVGSSVFAAVHQLLLRIASQDACCNSVSALH